MLIASKIAILWPLRIPIGALCARITRRRSRWYGLVFIAIPEIMGSRLRPTQIAAAHLVRGNFDRGTKSSRYAFVLVERGRLGYYDRLSSLPGELFYFHSAPCLQWLYN